MESGYNKNLDAITCDAFDIMNMFSDLRDAIGTSLLIPFDEENEKIEYTLDQLLKAAEIAAYNKRTEVFKKGSSQIAKAILLLGKGYGSKTGAMDECSDTILTGLNSLVSAVQEIELSHS